MHGRHLDGYGGRRPDGFGIPELLRNGFQHLLHALGDGFFVQLQISGVLPHKAAREDAAGKPVELFVLDRRQHA